MGARERGGHACTECGHRTAKWFGRCPECGAWASLVPAALPPGRADERSLADPPRAVPYPEVPIADATRMSTGIADLDRVLGGGVVPGAVVLIGGEPGIGKSTLVLQAAAAVAEAGRDVLYVTGEESAAQLRLRGDRLGVRSASLGVLASTDVDAVCEAAARDRPSLLIVDSVQAVRCADLPSVPGSVAQVRESAARLVALAKSSAAPVLLVGHVTKDGALAGPRTLEHVVDTVAYFEGDRHHAHRILRTSKNRFGASDEIAVFTMTEHGLDAVTNPSEVFLAERLRGTPGSAVHAAIEGTRPVLVEIQALVGEPTHGTPRRTSLGVDANRVAMILAVLNRSTGIEVSTRDVFVNVTGGLRVEEPGADLAVAAALVSSERRLPLPEGWVVMGEIGLTGEIRGISRIEARLREASRLGFRCALIPAGTGALPANEGLALQAVRRLDEAVDRLFG